MDCDVFAAEVKRNCSFFGMYPTECYEKNCFENSFSTMSNHGLLIEENDTIFPDGETETLDSSSILILSL